MPRAAVVVGSVFSTIVQLVLVIFTLFYLLHDGDRIVPAVRRPCRWKTMNCAKSSAVDDVISASVRGVMVIAAIQGVLGGIAYAFLGIKPAILWGVVTFVASMIPMAGSALVWVPAAIYLLITGHWIKALILILYGTLVISMIDNVLRPKLVGGANMHSWSSSSACSAACKCSAHLD